MSNKKIILIAIAVTLAVLLGYTIIMNSYDKSVPYDPIPLDWKTINK